MMRSALSFCIGLVSLALVCWPSSSAAQGVATLTDIDGNEYRVVKIGQQVWMAENLLVTRAPDGREIVSYFFNDDSATYAKYGRLYTWDVAMDGVLKDGAQGICPAGWHLPSDAEWTQLFDHLGGEDVAGKELAVGGSTGFDALLAGGADFRGNYLYFETIALLWSSTEVNEERAYHHHVDRDGKAGRFAAMKGARIYIRCIGDDS